MLLVQVEKVLAIQTGEVLRRKVFPCPWLILSLFFFFFYFTIFTVYYYRTSIVIELHMASELGNPLQQSCFRLYTDPERHG